MEGKERFDELLVAYILDEVNPDEAALVIEWLNADEQNVVYLEELRQTLHMVRMSQVIDEVNIDTEWNRFQQARDRKDLKPGFLKDSERFGNDVIREVGLKRKTSIYRTIALTAVAACVLLAIGLGWSLWTKEKPAQSILAVVEQKKSDAPESVVRNLVNNSVKAQVYHLQDGTIVQLFPGSELSFEEPFDADKRDLHLTGKADFDVAKDPSKPFTVFSGDISTTALGTRFVVTAFENSSNISVKLYEGKVVIKSVYTDQQHKGKYYLVPGQELVYNRPKNKTSIWAFNKSVVPRSTMPMEDLKPTELAADDPSIPKYGKGSWYMFNNQELDQVLDQLADMYNAEIKYSKKDVAKMYFIGTFNKSDSLETILRQITQLNKLKLRREKNIYNISKN